MRPSVALAAMVLLAALAHADDGPTVTPYRPSVSTPAALSAPGWLEVETGVLTSQGDDPTRRESLPYTLKLAFSPDWGIRLGGDAWVHQRNADGSSVQGGGDTSVVLKRRFAVDEAQALGLELGAKLPTARNGLGSGQADASLNAIYSADFAEAWHTDLNLNGTRLGGVGAGSGRLQTGWAAALSRSLDGGWGCVGELSGTRQRGVDSTAQALVAGSFNWSRALTLDFGVSKGLSSASGGWSAFAGFTVLATRLF